ncbi:hypothetical protein [Litoribacillus peritrichatus]|uniref:DUF3899 domain-containing protein n=1 Tax=Litoribacillus peritrichatus TaxID=718191 RepID=A0ABP7M7A3_9GAMM
MNNEIVVYITTFTWILACLGIFSWVGIVFYLKSKWLPLIEDILEGGRRLYSLNIYLAGQGSLHYATVFLSKWHAGRMNMQEKRENVPKNAQRIFILSFFFFMANFVLFFSTSVLIVLIRKYS